MQRREREDSIAGFAGAQALADTNLTFITYSSIRESKSLKTSLGSALMWLLARELEPESNILMWLLSLRPITLKFLK